MKITHALAIAATFEQATATFDIVGDVFKYWTDLKPFTCPGKVPVICKPDQVPGYNWKDTPVGPIGGYGGCNFKGWTCKKKFGRRDMLAGRQDDGSKLIEADVGAEGSNDNPVISAGDEIGVFDINSFSVESEFDARFEFHYTMPDGSVCKQSSPVSSQGTSIVNTQCGGAKSVKIVLPDNQGNQKRTFGLLKKLCKVKCHKIDFWCKPPPGKTTSTPPATPPPQTTTTKNTPPPQTTSTKPPGQTSSVSTPPGQSSSVSTPPGQTSSSISTPPGQTSSSVSTPPGQTTTKPPGQSSSVSTPPGQTSSSVSTPPGQTTTTKPPGQSSSVSTPPGQTSSSASTPPGQTSSSISTPPGQSSSISTPPGQTSSSVSTPPGQTTTKPPGQSSSVSTPPGQTSSSVSTPPGQTSSSVSTPPGQTSSISTPAPTSSVYTTIYETISTVFTTTTKTITSCGPEITSCPIKTPGGTHVITETISVSTTICPVTETRTQPQATQTPDQPKGTETKTSPPVPSQSLPCPESVPRCLSSWLDVAKECKNNADAACFCKNSEFTDKVFGCLYSYGGSDKNVADSISFFQGICASYADKNPNIVIGAGPINEIITVTAAPQPSGVAVTTIVVDTTITEACVTSGTTITGSSTTRVISTQIPVPQVTFTPPAGEKQPAPTGQPGKPAPGGSVPTSVAPGVPVGTGGVPTVPSGTAPPTVNGAGKAQAGLLGVVAMVVVAAL